MFSAALSESIDGTLLNALPCSRFHKICFQERKRENLAKYLDICHCDSPIVERFFGRLCGSGQRVPDRGKLKQVDEAVLWHIMQLPSYQQIKSIIINRLSFPKRKSQKRLEEQCPKSKNNKETANKSMHLIFVQERETHTYL